MTTRLVNVKYLTSLKGLMFFSDFWKFLGKTQISPGEALPPRTAPDRDGQSDELMWVTSFAKDEMMLDPASLQLYMESKDQSQDSELCCQRVGFKGSMFKGSEVDHLI